MIFVLIVIGKIGANIAEVHPKLTKPMMIVYSPNFDSSMKVANNNGMPDIVIKINGNSIDIGTSPSS